MRSLREGDIHFTFSDAWQAELFDEPGAIIPKRIYPVNFVVEGDNDLVLVEVKDPSAARVPGHNLAQSIRKMRSKELTYQELVPKARTSYGFLHLMARDTKRMRYVVVIGLEKLSIDPFLLSNLNDMLRNRLAQETETAWKRPFIADCTVISIADFPKALPGCSATRITSAPLR